MSHADALETKDPGALQAHWEQRVRLVRRASKASTERKESWVIEELLDQLDHGGSRAVVESMDSRATEASQATGVRTESAAWTASTESRE